jgi:sulfur relay (sulfurtransferase) DsrC/TusE family protein
MRRSDTLKRLDNKGATSVLIILLMVVLMVFGLTILTTTLSNKSLSEKKQVWLKDYYQLEADVALKLAEVDKQLDELKQEAKLGNLDLVEVYQEKLEIQEYNNRYYMNFDISEQSGDYLKHIMVELQLIINKNIDAKNYKIVKYSETQDLFEYEDIKFGNPFFPNED